MKKKRLICMLAVLVMLACNLSAPKPAPTPAPPPANSGALILPTATPKAQVTALRPTAASSRPSPTPQRYDLGRLLAQNMVEVSGAHGQSLTKLGLELKSIAYFDLQVEILPGSLFEPLDEKLERMVVRDRAVVDLRPGETLSLELDAAGIEMFKDTPRQADVLTFKGSNLVSPDLKRLLDSPAFAAEDFAIQQFAVWTVTDNPETFSDFTGISSAGFNGQPGSEELARVAGLLTAAGVDPGKYEAVKRISGSYVEAQEVWTYSSSKHGAVVLSAGLPVVFYWGWGAAAYPYLQDFIEAASFELRLDGQPVDVSAARRSLRRCEDGKLCVKWRTLPQTLQPGSHTFSFVETLKQEISDGLDSEGDGRLDVYRPGTVTLPPCELAVE